MAHSFSFSHPSMPEQNAVAVAYSSPTTAPIVQNQSSAYYPLSSAPYSLRWLPKRAWDHIQSDPRGEQGYSKEYAAQCYYTLLGNKGDLSPFTADQVGAAIGYNTHCIWKGHEIYHEERFIFPGLVRVYFVEQAIRQVWSTWTQGKGYSDAEGCIRAAIVAGGTFSRLFWENRIPILYPQMQEQHMVPVPVPASLDSEYVQTQHWVPVQDRSYSSNYSAEPGKYLIYQKSHSTEPVIPPHPLSKFHRHNDYRSPGATPYSYVTQNPEFDPRNSREKTTRASKRGVRFSRGETSQGDGAHTRSRHAESPAIQTVTKRSQSDRNVVDVYKGDMLLVHSKPRSGSRSRNPSSLNQGSASYSHEASESKRPHGRSRDDHDISIRQIEERQPPHSRDLSRSSGDALHQGHRSTKSLSSTQRISSHSLHESIEGKHMRREHMATASISIPPVNTSPRQSSHIHDEPKRRTSEQNKRLSLTQKVMSRLPGANNHRSTQSVSLSTSRPFQHESKDTGDSGSREHRRAQSFGQTHNQASLVRVY